MRPVLALMIGGVACATTLLWAAPADAFERQWHAGASFGYALASDETATSHGFGGGLHLTYGLTDAFNAMMEVDLTVHPSHDLLLGNVSLGAGYVIDVLQWVPYVGIMIGGYDIFHTDDVCGTAGAASCHQGRLGGSIPFGLDYNVSRSFAVGVAGRYNLLFLGDSPVSYLTAFARAELVWGY